MTDVENVEPGFELLAIAAYTLSPHLEIAAEVCLKQAAAGKRVAFAFLDVANPDEFPVGTVVGPAFRAVRRRSRMKFVRTIERILREHGVTVIDSCSPVLPGVSLSCASTQIDSSESLMAFRFDDAKLGLGVMSSLSRHVGDSAPSVEANRALTDELLTAACRTFLAARRLIQESRPAAVLVFNGRFACSKAISEAARLSGVKVLYQERGASYLRYFYADRSPHSSEYGRRALREAWERAADNREEIAERFFSRDRGGVPMVELEFNDNQVPGASIPTSGRRRIVYYASSIDEYTAVEDGIEHPVFPSQLAAVEWLAAWTWDRPDTELVIRMHPRMTRIADREMAAWRSLASKNVIVVEPRSPIDSYALAESADAVVSFHSSMGVEATYMGKVSILVGDADYRGSDCVYEPHSTSELDAMLTNRGLAPKPRAHCLPFGYHRLMLGDAYQFYQPVSFHRGSLFGEELSSDDPPVVATMVWMLYKFDRALRVLQGRR